jgi:hypothetical protein
MNKQPSSAMIPSRPSWRRAGAAVLLACMLAGIVPARAQDPSSNEAVLNFVGADIESVVKPDFGKAGQQGPGAATAGVGAAAAGIYHGQ